MKKQIKQKTPENNLKNKKQNFSEPFQHIVLSFWLIVPYTVLNTLLVLNDPLPKSTYVRNNHFVVITQSFLCRLWWISIISISVYICGLLIKSTWQKWEDTPVFISMSQKPVPLQNIPFPAVTICPGYQYNKNSTFVFPIYASRKSDADVLFRSGNISILCDENITGMTDYEREYFLTEPNISTFFVEV